MKTAAKKKNFFGIERHRFDGRSLIGDSLPFGSNCIERFANSEYDRIDA